LLFQPPLGLSESLTARSSNRPCVSFALRVQLTAAVAKPLTSSPRVFPEPLNVQLDRQLNDLIRRRVALAGSLFSSRAA